MLSFLPKEKQVLTSDEGIEGDKIRTFLSSFGRDRSLSNPKILVFKVLVLARFWKRFDKVISGFVEDDHNFMKIALFSLYNQSQKLKTI